MNFGKPVDPCEDCVDGNCTMNCSRPMRDRAASPWGADTGSMFITREKDGKTFTVKVRSPESEVESSVSLPAEVFRAMVVDLI